MVTVAHSGLRHRKTNGGGGGGFRVVASVGGLPSGPFFYARSRDRSVHGQAPAPRYDLLPGLHGLAEVARLQLGFTFLPNSDEEQPPKEDQQL